MDLADLLLAFGDWVVQRGLVTKTKWRDLSPRARKLIVAGAVVEGVLKAAALSDVVRRPADQVRGSKWRWVAALIVINSGGLAPIVYFRKGRRT